MDGDDSATDAAGTGLAQGTHAARDTEPGPATAADRDDGHGHSGRAGHRLGLEIDAELVFGEPPAWCGRELRLHHRREPLLLQPGQMGAGAVGAVAVDHPVGGRLALARDQVAQQGGRDHGVAAGGRAHLGRSDDLRVRIGRDVALIAVEAMRSGLVPVAGLGVHGGDDPIRCGPLEDPKAPVRRLLDVLAGHRGQQRRRLGHPRIQPFAPQGKVGPAGIPDQRVHQRLTGRPIGPVTGRLARRPVVVLALQQPPDLGRQLR